MLVPKIFSTGWQIVRIVDVKKTGNTWNGSYEHCDCCGQGRVRYAYYMQNSESDEQICVGSTCAGRLSGTVCP